jgi:predicted metal-dependent HD superfamily phosphohydrolase
MIRLTDHQEALSEEAISNDAAVLCDADLAILGAEPERFDHYDRQIREEYAWVPEPVYRQKRGEVLAGFLERPRIYRTRPFF